MAHTPATNRIRTRAMHRALATLRDNHRGEYEFLLAKELMLAKREAAEHVAAARRQHPNEGPPIKPPGVTGPKFSPLPPMPPKLKTGPRDVPEVIEAVASCPYCIRYHRRGHECSACRSRPLGAPAVDPYVKVG